MFIEVLVVFAGLSDESVRRVFVDLAVLIAGEYLLSAEIWVLRYVCLKWYETFVARALRCSLRRGFIYEGVERG